MAQTVPLVWDEDSASFLCAMDVAGFKAEGEVGGDRVSQVCHAENRGEGVRAAVGNRAADSVPGKTEGGWGGRGETELGGIFVLSCPLAVPPHLLGSGMPPV